MSAFKCTRKVYCKICSQEYNMSKTQWFWVDSDNFRSLDGLPLYHLVKAERCAEHAIFKPLTKNIQQFPSFEVVSDLVESERKHQHLNEHHDLPKSIYWPLNILKFMTRYGSSNVNPTPPRWRILRYGFAPRPPISKENVGETQIGCIRFCPRGVPGRLAPVVALPFFPQIAIAIGVLTSNRGGGWRTTLADWTWHQGAIAGCSGRLAIAGSHLRVPM